MGAGSTLLLLARNKDDLEVMNSLPSKYLFKHFEYLQETKEIVRDVRPGLAVEVFALPCTLDSTQPFFHKFGCQ